ncbi:sigma-54-dependent transcriptional regulator [candidate division KSB1 bacterium]
MSVYSILCVDDDKRIIEVLTLILKSAGYKVYSAFRAVEALKIAENEHIDFAIVDYKMPEMNGIELLKEIKDRKSEIEVLILTGHGTIPNAVEAIKLGAFDYIIKPFHKNDLLHRIKKAKDLKNLRQENVLLKSQLKDKYQGKNFVGRTPGMVKINEMIPKIASSNSTVLILGETGTGKEEVAKAIHYSGIRSDKKFNIVDCASINPNLIESELFGHVKGAFTGAIYDKDGLLKATGNGTLFLDEIAEIPVYIQVKLLRAIEEQVVRPVGSVESLKFNARIMAATSRNLEQAIENREFREDLYFRLNVVTVKIPPLRERKDDIPLLVKHFLSKYEDDNKLITGISKEVMNIFMGYGWPGNVRELENCIERAYTLNVQGEIDAADIPEKIAAGTRRSEITAPGDTATMSEHEKAVIIQALEKTGGNKREAARMLKIGVTTLYRKLKKYNIA